MVQLSVSPDVLSVEVVKETDKSITYVYRKSKHTIRKGGAGKLYDTFAAAKQVCVDHATHKLKEAQDYLRKAEKLYSGDCSIGV
jgi:hypothetical protein